jgi:tRNA pseudouridine55 synthase
MLGVVNLDKPVGVTSHDMVGLLRRLTGLRRIGHAGTLDPLASGVLPILVGAATRFSEELTGGRKRYDAVVRLGISSATDDAEGPLLPGGGPVPPRPAIEAALAPFRGEFAQRPPAFSARKLGGETAHRAARAGRPLELAPRLVTVERLELTDLVPGDGWVDASLELVCGPGTYVRSIARDLGAALGCGGHLHALRRREAAGLLVEDAVRPEQLEELARAGRLADVVMPVAGLLPLPRLTLAPEAATRFRNGSPLDATDASDGRRVVLDDAGALLGIGNVTNHVLHPDKVVAYDTGAAVG